jgi:hypothetical protein
VSLVPSNLSRQTFSFGVQAWVPLVEKEKVTRDPR